MHVAKYLFRIKIACFNLGNTFICWAVGLLAAYLMLSGWWSWISKFPPVHLPHLLQKKRALAALTRRLQKSSNQISFISEQRLVGLISLSWTRISFSFEQVEPSYYVSYPADALNDPAPTAASFQTCWSSNVALQGKHRQTSFFSNAFCHRIWRKQRLKTKSLFVCICLHRTDTKYFWLYIYIIFLSVAFPLVLLMLKLDQTADMLVYRCPFLITVLAP